MYSQTRIPLNWCKQCLWNKYFDENSLGEPHNSIEFAWRSKAECSERYLLSFPLKLKAREALFTRFNTEYSVDILETHTPNRAALCIKDIYPEIPLHSACETFIYTFFISACQICIFFVTCKWMLREQYSHSVRWVSIVWAREKIGLSQSDIQKRI